MYEHDINLEENVSRTSAILDDVHHVEIVDLVTETFIFLFAGLFNTCLIAVETRRWRRTRSMNIPRILIVCLASIDAVGVFVGLLPKFLVLAVIPCPRMLFSVVHLLTVTVHVFSILMSKMTVVLMGIERYASILMPFFYVRTFTPKLVLVAEIVCAVYAVLFAAVSSFFNYYHYHDTYIYYHDLHEHAHDCHEYFLIFEFGSINHKVDFPWRFAELCGSFQCYQLAQDILLIVIVVICNSAVMNGLSKMDRRMRQVCPVSGSETTRERSAAPAPSFSGREFSRLMTLINVFVIVLTTPQMVRNLCNYLHVAPSYIADFTCQRIALCSACVNPFLYGLLRQNVRTNIKQLFLHMFSRSRERFVWLESSSTSRDQKTQTCTELKIGSTSEGVAVENF